MVRVSEGLIVGLRYTICLLQVEGGDEKHSNLQGTEGSLVQK